MRHALLLLGLSGVLAPGGAAAHSRLTQPTPRTSRDDYKDFNGGLTACLTDPTTVPPTIYAAGQTVNVQWLETINHPGCFLVSVRVGPNGPWQDLANIKHMAVGDTPRPWSATVQLPAGAVGDGSVLLLRQIMLLSETDPCPPSPIPTNVTYYSCADIQLVAGDGGHVGVPGGGMSDGGVAGPAPGRSCGGGAVTGPLLLTLALGLALLRRR